MTKIEEIKKILKASAEVYGSTSVNYVGGMAYCHVVNLLGGRYGHDSVEDLLKTADESRINQVHKYLTEGYSNLLTNGVCG